jgi:hypothetical protein
MNLMKFIFGFLLINLFLIDEVQSNSKESECDDLSVNYEEDQFLTKREQIEMMDEALIASLDKFESCIKSQSNLINNDNSNPSSSTSFESQELSGNASSTGSEELSENMDSDTNSSELDESQLSYENESNNDIQSTGKNENFGSNGKLPEDIPQDDNDDVLAKQIKNAALKEKDPEKREKIWNEYRKYKNLPLSD